MPTTPPSSPRSSRWRAPWAWTWWPRAWRPRSSSRRSSAWAATARRAISSPSRWPPPRSPSFSPESPRPRPPRIDRSSAVIRSQGLEVLGEDALRLRLAQRGDELHLHRVVAGPDRLEPAHAGAAMAGVRVAVHLRRDRGEDAILEIILPPKLVSRAARLDRGEARADLRGAAVAARRLVFRAAFLEPRVGGGHRLRAHRWRLGGQARLP